VASGSERLVKSCIVVVRQLV